MPHCSPPPRRVGYLLPPSGRPFCLDPESDRRYRLRRSPSRTTWPRIPHSSSSPWRRVLLDVQPLRELLRASILPSGRQTPIGGTKPALRRQVRERDRQRAKRLARDGAQPHPRDLEGARSPLAARGRLPRTRTRRARVGALGANLSAKPAVLQALIICDMCEWVTHPTRPMMPVLIQFHSRLSSVGVRDDDRVPHALEEVTYP